MKRVLLVITIGLICSCTDQGQKQGQKQENKSCTLYVNTCEGIKTFDCIYCRGERGSVWGRTLDGNYVETTNGYYILKNN